MWYTATVSWNSGRNQAENGLVTMVKSADAMTTKSATVDSERFQGRLLRGNIDESGVMSSEGRATAVSKGRMPAATMHENGGSKAGEVLWVVTDDELETLPRNQVLSSWRDIRT